MTAYLTPKRITMAVVGLIIFAMLAVGGSAGCKSYNRYQKRADAKNNITVTKMNIEATKARAEMRFQESVGIKRAQDEIQRTLSPIYIQHEAIQAQKEIATSGKNNTVIYVPAGTNGTPIINQPAIPSPTPDGG